MISKCKCLVIAAGGTGGHVFPGLAVAKYLVAQNWKVHWIGTSDHMEANLVPKHGIDIDFINIDGLRGKSVKKRLVTLLKMWQAWRQACSIIQIHQPNVVLGMGGYVSGPVGLAARSCGVPIILHEQNSVSGLTNRFLAKIACKVLQAFPGAFPYADIVGNPVRNDILNLPAPDIRFKQHTGPIRILVIGGSQGAHILNKTMPIVASLLSDNLTLWHQVGKGASIEVEQNYLRIGSKIQHKVVEFIDDMAQAYSWADLIISRAGAMTISEIAVVGLPALLVPLMHKDNQQYWNAKYLEQTGAARIIDQKSFTAEYVSGILSNLNRTLLLHLANRARLVAVPNATKLLAQKVVEITR